MTPCTQRRASKEIWLQRCLENLMRSPRTLGQRLKALFALVYQRRAGPGSTFRILDEDELSDETTAVQSK